MGRPARGGESPVSETHVLFVGHFLSTARPEKPCRNPGLPRSKAKHDATTDSEEVPRGKGEKNPGEGSETEPETMSPQQVGARGNPCDGVPFVE
jgi:hypothetical protein